MSYFVYAKWNLFCIHKRRFMNTRFVKKINTEVAKWIWWGLAPIQIVISFFLAKSIMSISEINMFVIGNISLGRIMSDEIIIGCILLGYILLTSVLISAQIGSFILIDCDDEWISVNYGLESNIIKIIKIINYVLYSSRELITFIFPVAIAFLLHWKKLDFSHVIELILILMCVLEVRIMASIIFCVYKISVNSINLNLVTTMTLIRNVLLFFLALYFGKFFSTWLNSFPIISKHVDGEIVQAWFDAGGNIFLNLLNKYQNIFEIGRHYLSEYSVVFFIVIQIVLMIIIKSFCKIDKKRREYNKKIYFFESLFKRDLYCKAVLGCRNSIYGINYLFENAVFWGITGLFAGMMVQVEQVKILFFLCMACAVYFSVFITISNYNKNIQIYSLDGEGKKICFWIGNIPKLFIKKYIIWIINMMSMSAIEYLLIFLCIRRVEILPFFILQSAYCSLLFFVLSIPGVWLPYYNYSNISELSEYVDRKKVNETIEPILLLGVNSLIVMPVALFMCDFISYKLFSVIQFVVIPVFLCVVAFVMYNEMRRVISGKEYLDKIYKG